MWERRSILLQCFDWVLKLVLQSILPVDITDWRKLGILWAGQVHPVAMNTHALECTGCQRGVPELPSVFGIETTV